MSSEEEVEKKGIAGVWAEADRANRRAPKKEEQEVIKPKPYETHKRVVIEGSPEIYTVPITCARTT